MIGRKRLGRKHIERRASEMSGAQGRDKVGLDDDGSARNIEEEGARLHAGELRRTNQAARLFGQRTGERDDVGSGEKLIERRRQDMLRETLVPSRMSNHS